MMIAVFEDGNGAAAMLQSLKSREKKGLFRLFNAAVLVKDETGKTTTKETLDLESGRGALFGALVGGLIGMLGGPAGALIGAAAGAATGGITAGKVDLGFSNQFLSEIQKYLKPGCSALVLIVEKNSIEPVVAEFEQQHTKLFRHVVKTEIAQRFMESDQESI